MQQRKLSVGLDLGNCHSTFACLDADGKVDVFKEDNSSRIPTVVYAVAENGQVRCSTNPQEAGDALSPYDEGNVDNEEVLGGQVCFKPVLGRTHTQEVPSFARRANGASGVEVRADPADGFRPKFVYEGIMFSPESALEAWLLKYLREALASFGMNRTDEEFDLTLTVPNNCSMPVKEAYQRICQNVLPRASIEIIREAFAAFVTHIHQAAVSPGSKNVLVIDIGDGTLDVDLEAVTHTTDQPLTCMTLMTDGDSECAGRDQTLAMHKYMNRKFLRAFYEESGLPDTPQFKERRKPFTLKDAELMKALVCDLVARRPGAESYKASLRKTSKAKMLRQSPESQKWSDITLSRQDLEDTFGRNTHKVRDFMTRFVGRLREARHSVNVILLVGGGVRGYGVKDTILQAMPEGRAFVQDAFVSVAIGGAHWSRLKTSAAPQTAGTSAPLPTADAHAGTSASPQAAVTPVFGRPLTPNAFGVVYCDDADELYKVKKVIERDTSLPARKELEPTGNKTYWAQDMKRLGNSKRYVMDVEVVEGLFDDMAQVVDLGPSTTRYPMTATAGRNANDKPFSLIMEVDASGWLILTMRIGGEESTDKRRRRQAGE